MSPLEWHLLGHNFAIQDASKRQKRQDYRNSGSNGTCASGGVNITKNGRFENHRAIS
jgi:hypothetical protein